MIYKLYTVVTRHIDPVALLLYFYRFYVRDEIL